MYTDDIPILDVAEKEKIEKKRTQMLNEPIPKLICKMAVPTIISMLVTSFYNLVDTFFVGQLGSNSATGAVGLVFSLMAIIQAFGYFFGHGSGNFISRAIGKRDYENAAKMASTGLFSSVFIGGLILAFGLMFRRPLVFLLGATPSMADDTVAYMTYILIGAPYMVGAFVLNNQLRLQGNSIFSMIGLVSGAIINVILDPILIFACHMGVAGAALATIIGQLVSFIILFIGCQKSSNVTIRWRNFTLKRMYYTEIISGGLPSLGRQGLASIATLLLNHFAGIYGDAAIAAFSVVTKITNTSFSVILGFGQGFQPVCGFNYGGGRYDRVRKAVIFSIHISTAFLLLVGIVIYVFASPLITLFRDDALVVAIGTDALRYQCIAMPFFGLIIIMNMFLQNIRRVLSASIMATARQGLIFIPAVLILNYFFGLWGLAVAQPVADICTFILAIPLGIPVLNHMEPIPKDSK